MLANFHFMRPWWLLAIIPVLLLWWLLHHHRQEQSPWQQLIAQHLQPLMLVGEQLKRKPWAMPLLALCWVISVVALSGPSWQKLPQPVLTVKKATVLIMDMSMSMRATDMAPDRLTQQRFKALDLVEQLKEGDLALISFAADAFVISPLTPDHNNIRLQIPTLRPELMPEQGSNVLSALTLAGNLLTQAGYPQGDVILFTDGFDSNSFRELQNLLNTWPHKLSILAFGQAEGAVVRLENGELLKNAQGGVVIPRVPLQQLSVLAQQGGGQFMQAALDNRDLQALLTERNPQQADRAPQALLAGDQWQDNAVYLVWLLLPIAAWLARRAPVLVLLPLLYLPDAQAFSWRDLWQTKQQQAINDYQQQDYLSAQQKFRDPLWQGNAAYRAGDYASAANAFEQAIAKAPSVDSWHNLGNALAMQQEYKKALNAYEQALALDNNATPSADNAELMRQLLEQQEQQQNQQNAQDNTGQSQQQQNQQGEQGEQDKQTAEQQNADNQSSQQASGQPNQPSEPQTGEQADAANAEQQQMAQAAEAAKEEGAEQAQQQAIAQSWPNATPEQQQELENLLRKVQDDPGLLLRNRMLLEHQKRRTQPPPGARQEW